MYYANGADFDAFILNNAPVFNAVCLSRNDKINRVIRYHSLTLPNVERGQGYG